uniref:Gem-associated protein 2 n=1 Tax=Pavo cristatus TaxID=9049 RepID=A0A8C9FWK8_PAVCR
MESAVEELMPRLLPVGDCDLPDDFDPTVPPRTPQEYLRRVQIEAARCPDVVVAQIDPKKLRKKPTVNIAISGCQPAPEGYSPTLKWQQQQVANFSSVRQVENSMCDGDWGGVFNLHISKQNFAGITLSLYVSLLKATVTSVLEYLISWFGEKKFTPELGRWFYALLACLEKPLLPEAHSLIRQLARRCSEVRVLEENKNEEQVSALNLLICLVSRYFDQRDLADEPS